MEDQANKLRFQIELEFVQCLANPNYLNFLAQRGHFREATFINYLKYLQYWKEPEYAKYLKYPMSLYFLDLLQYPEFRKELANNRCAKFIEDQQLLHWQNYIRKRTKLAQSTVATSTTPGTATTAASELPAHILNPPPHQPQNTNIAIPGPSSNNK